MVSIGRTDGGGRLGNWATQSASAVARHSTSMRRSVRDDLPEITVSTTFQTVEEQR